MGAFPEHGDCCMATWSAMGNRVVVAVVFVVFKSGSPGFKSWFWLPQTTLFWDSCLNTLSFIFSSFVKWHNRSCLSRLLQVLNEVMFTWSIWLLVSAQYSLVGKLWANYVITFPLKNGIQTQWILSVLQFCQLILVYNFLRDVYNLSVSPGSYSRLCSQEEPNKYFLKIISINTSF